MKILVTGSAGFIGFFTCLKLLERGNQVFGLDNLNDYYDVGLKKDRLKELESYKKFNFFKIDISNRLSLDKFFKEHNPQKVIHLAAQAGVRYSLENPYSYIDANISGFLNILEAVRSYGTEHLVYASTSSVYGANTNMPFSTTDSVDHPLSLYAATKKSNELMAHTYSHLFGIPTTGLRFFTVYGPWGRPDMALFKFTKNILSGDPIEVFNHGQHTRDFTFIEDIVEGVVRVCDKPAVVDANWDSDNPLSSSSKAPYRLFNIGSNNPQHLMKYIEVLEDKLGKKAEKVFLPMQLGDVPDTSADVKDLLNYINYKPSTSIEEGIEQFVEWYLGYYK